MINSPAREEIRRDKRVAQKLKLKIHVSGEEKSP